MITIITVVYTDKKLSSTELKDKKQYNFKSNYEQLKVGDLIKSPAYTTKMQIVNINYNINVYKYPLKFIEITSINDKDLNKVIEKGNNSNIELISPTYKIENKRLSFEREVSSLEKAKEIQNNIENVNDFIDVILKYGNINTEGAYSRKYKISRDGLLEELIFNYEEITYDTWSGRPPLCKKWSKKYTMEELNTSIVPKIKNSLSDSIKELETITSKVNSISYNIFKEINLFDKIGKLKKDLKLLDNYEAKI